MFLIFPNIHPSICIFDSQPLVSFKTFDFEKQNRNKSHDENKIRESYLSETLHRNTFDNVFSSIASKIVTPWSWSMKWRNSSTKTCRSIFNESARSIREKRTFTFILPQRAPNLFLSSRACQLHFTHEWREKICIPIPYRSFHSSGLRIIIQLALNDQNSYELSWNIVNFHDDYNHMISESKGKIRWIGGKLKFSTNERSDNVHYVSLTLQPQYVNVDTQIEHNFLSNSFENCISQPLWTLDQPLFNHFYAWIDRL